MYPITQKKGQKSFYLAIDDLLSCFFKLAKLSIIIGPHWVQVFSHISESQCDPNTKGIPLKQPSVKIKRGQFRKKIVNPFWRKVDYKVNDVDLRPLSTDHPLQICHLKENLMPNKVICNISPNTN